MFSLSRLQQMGNSDLEVNVNSVITTHCVSTVIIPGDKQLHDPLQFVKIKSNELCQKVNRFDNFPIIDWF